MRFEIDKLRVVAQVGRVGSVTAAARSLHLTPSAVSQTIHRVEAAIGMKLLERRPHGMAMTYAGEVVMRRVALIEAQIVLLRSDLEAIEAGQAGHVSLGVFPTLASSLLPQIVTEFRSRHPNINLHVRSARLAALRSLVAANELDLAVTWTYPWSPELLPSRLLREDPTVLLVPSNHPLAREQPPIQLNQLADEAWICRSDGHEITELLHRSAAVANFTPRIAIAANDYQETQAMVAAGLGIALAPKLSTSTCRNDITAMELDSSVSSRELHLVYLKDRVSPAAEKIMEVLKELIMKV